MVLGTGDQAHPQDLLVDQGDKGGPSLEEPHVKEVKVYGWH